ncbi:MAG: hypothetical protein GF315_06505 [candidate division Zixibacteria bacterium]|nr:hypothetical protein [candidate division Zixibacteria bacterium]
MKELIIGIVAVSIIALATAAAAENIDRIIAVVDDEIILKSEVLSQFQIMAEQGAYSGLSENQIQEAQMDLLDKMIDDKLMLILAREDTSISVSPQEVNEALEEHIQRVRSRFPSEESFLSQLEEEGLTLRDLRNRYRDEVGKQLLKERLLNSHLRSTSVNNQEVRDFYNTYKDSLPVRPASIKLAHVLIEISPGEEALSTKRIIAEDVHQQLIAGADFSELAAAYSDDPTGKSGGDLGFFGRGDMVPEFEREAYSLTKGEISNVVRTSYGYHIIKCTDRDGEQIRCSHILFATQPSPADTARAMAKADSLYEVIAGGARFEDIAKEHSSDADSKVFGGELGWYAVGELSPDFKTAIGDKQEGTIIPPAMSESGIHILKVLERQPERPVDLKLDWDELKEMAKRQKANDKLMEQIESARQKYYVEVREFD